MFKALILSIYLALLVSTTGAQQILFCKGYTEKGEPIDQILNGRLKAGETISILFKNNKAFDKNFIFFYIDRIESGSATNVSSKMFYPEKNKNWIAATHKFSEGRYRIYFTDFGRNTIASAMLDVAEVKRPDKEPAPETELAPEAKVIFCEKVIKDYPKNFINSVSMEKHGGEVYVFLVGNRPLSTSILRVSIWKQETRDDGYDKFIDSKKFEIKPEWYDTYFKYRFGATGKYKFSFFDSKDLLIKTAYIAVEK